MTAVLQSQVTGLEWLPSIKMLGVWESSCILNAPHKFETVCFYNANVRLAGVGNNNPRVSTPINFEIILILIS